jgi:hypothetical protein
MSKDEWDVEKSEFPSRRCEFRLSPLSVNIIKVTAEEHARRRESVKIAKHERYPKV